jgi:hypothetical protein
VDTRHGRGCQKCPQMQGALNAKNAGCLGPSFMKPLILFYVIVVFVQNKCGAIKTFMSTNTGKIYKIRQHLNWYSDWLIYLQKKCKCKYEGK